jgi:hypothetical protein
VGYFIAALYFCFISRFADRGSKYYLTPLHFFSRGKKYLGFPPRENVKNPYFRDFFTKSHPSESRNFISKAYREFAKKNHENNGFFHVLRGGNPKYFLPREKKCRRV